MPSSSGGYSRGHTVLVTGASTGMIERGRGGVLNVASPGAFVPSPRFAVFTAGKAYVLASS